MSPSFVVLLASLALGLFACGALGRAGGTSNAGQDAQHFVASSVRAWFAALEAEPPDARALARFLVRSPLELRRSEAGAARGDEILAWLVALRSPHPQVAYQLGEIRSDAVEDGRLWLRFEADRHAVDVAGVSHVERRAFSWWFRNEPGAVPVVLEMDDRPLPYFPGTGPQIVCY